MNETALFSEFSRQGFLGVLLIVALWVIYKLAIKIQQLNETRLSETMRHLELMGANAAAMDRQSDALNSQANSFAALAKATEEDSRALRSLEDAIRGDSRPAHRRRRDDL